MIAQGTRLVWHSEQRLWRTSITRWTLPSRARLHVICSWRPFWMTFDVLSVSFNPVSFGHRERCQWWHWRHVGCFCPPLLACRHCLQHLSRIGHGSKCPHISPNAPRSRSGKHSGPSPHQPNPFFHPGQRRSLITWLP